MKLYQTRDTGSYWFAKKFAESAKIEDFPGLTNLVAGEYPRILHNDGSKTYVHGGDWLIYPALSRADGHPVKPFGTQPSVYSDERFHERFMACDGNDDERHFRRSIVNLANRYIADVRRRDEDGALGAFKGRKYEPITKENVAEAIQYLEKLRHVIAIRDFIEQK